jgi:hypothetical protein
MCKILAILILSAYPALADTGPCRLNAEREIQICGTGDGAAIVIRDTQSPSKKIALAWRTPGGPPTEQPDDEKIELLVLRLSDGAILARSKGAYWDTGEMHVNRLEERAAWSPNSRLLVRSFHSRFSTDEIEIYALDDADKVTGRADFLKLLDPSVRTKLKARAKDTNDYSLSLTGMKDDDKTMTIDDRGNIRAEVMLWAPKYGPMHYFRVTARVLSDKGKLSAKIISVDYRGMEKEQR